MLFLALILASVSQAAPLSFQADITWEAPHALSWTYQAPSPHWNKTSRAPVLRCDEKHSYQLQWLNSKMVKATITPSLSPGEKCDVEYDGMKKTFEAPKIKVMNVEPWRFSENMNEEDPIAVITNRPLDVPKFIKAAYISVEGQEEKIGLNPVDKKEVDLLKGQAYVPEGQYAHWFQTRLRLPTGKKIRLIIPEGQTYAFQKEGKVQDPFTLTTSCQRELPTSPCSPLGKLDIRLTSAIDTDQLKEIYLVVDGKKHFLKASPGEHVTYAAFDATLPALSKVTLYVPDNLKDIDGRELSNRKKFPLEVSVGEFPPLVKFSSAVGVIEAGYPVLPFAVRKTEQPLKIQLNHAAIKDASAADIMRWLKKSKARQTNYGEEDVRHISIFEGEKAVVKTKDLENKLSDKAIEMVGLPLEGKGLHLVEAASPRLGKSLLGEGKTYFVSTLALVTDLAIHLKVGEENALAWVTNLSEGKPVAGAKVVLSDCKGKLIEEQVSGTDGVAKFNKITKENRECSPEDYRTNYIVTASYKDDFAFTLSSWNEGIESYRFGISWYYEEQSQELHTTFDRPLYRPGETVSFLVLAREHMKDMRLSLSKTKPAEITITHVSDKKWKEKLTWNGLAGGKGQFKLSEDAPLGTYTLTVKIGKTEHVAGGFRVERISIPSMQLTTSWKDKKKIMTSREGGTLLGSMKFLAGGAAQDIPIKIRGNLDPGYGLDFEDWKDYSFANGGLDWRRKERTAIVLESVETKTDKKGDLRHDFKSLPSRSYVQYLNVELEYLDASGQYQSRFNSATVVPSMTLVGIKQPEMIAANEKKSLDLAVTDPTGKGLPDRRVQVEIHKVETISVRKKILGGFYTYNSSEELKKTDFDCDGKTNAKGRLVCPVDLKEAGDYVIVARTKDDNGNLNEAVLNFWIHGENYWQSQEAYDRADLLADKKSYSVGETARLALKTPFQTGTILVTRERDGIISHEVRRLESGQQILPVSLSKKDVPNIYVSAFAVRGRISDAIPGVGQIDLGKPAYRMGLTELKVSDPERELKLALEVKPSQVSPRQEVTVDIKLGSKADAKVAVAVIDEGLLQLGSHYSFNSKDLFQRMAKHNVATSTLQMQVMGKRHFGLKAKPAGGSGGNIASRELFDTLLYWNPEVALNEKGVAQIKFKTNDSLTRFRVFALAYAVDRFGNAEISFESKQDVLVFPGISQRLRVGDKVSARFQVKNTTSEAKNINVVYGNSLADSEEKNLKLAAEEGAWVEFRMKEPKVAGAILHELTTKVDGKVIDKLKIKQTVLPVNVARVGQADFVELNKEVKLPVPKDGAGTKIALSRSPLGSSDGIEAYMREYPFNCLEQKWAKVLVLKDKSLQREFMRDLPIHQDSYGLMRFYPSRYVNGDVALTAHILETAHWANVSLPADVKSSALNGMVMWLNGKIPLDTYQKSNLKRLKLHYQSVVALIDPPQQASLESPTVPNKEDSFGALVDKFIIYQKRNQGAEASATWKLLSDSMANASATVHVRNMQQEFWGDTKTQQLSRFLLMSETLPLAGDDKSVYTSARPRWWRSYSSMRKAGHYGGTLDDSWASVVIGKLAQGIVTGTTLVNGKPLAWAQTNPEILLDEKALEVLAKHQGSGVPYMDVGYLHFPDLTKKSATGFTVAFTGNTTDLKVGETVEYVWKVESDAVSGMSGWRAPLPAGATIITTSVDGAELQFEEKDMGEWRAYLASTPKGAMTFKARVRFDQSGSYQVPGASMEELYAPERNGREILRTWNVK